MLEDAGEDNGNGHGDIGERKLNVRARVWRACEVCRKRKVKCNGQEPCAYCITSGKVCSFKDINDNAAVARQQASTVDSRLTKVEDALQRIIPLTEAFENWLQSNGPAQPAGAPLSMLANGLSAGPSAPSRADSQPERYCPSPTVQRLSKPNYAGIVSSPGEEENGPTQWSDRFSHLTKDSYGNLRYTGGSSSYMFRDALTTLEDRRHSQPSPAPSSSQGGDPSVNLPFLNPTQQWLRPESLLRIENISYPSPAVADELVSIYFTTIHRTFPLLHQHDFLQRYMRAMTAKQDGLPITDTTFLALLFSVFACGACIGRKKGKAQNDSNGSPTIFYGVNYYESAQTLFWMSSGQSKLEHVQCLILLAVCNVTWNTLAQGWLNTGQAIRRGQDLGIHRSPRPQQFSQFDKEMRRRVWWCVYCIDRLLSVTLGRPCGVHDDDCNVGLPSEVDDSQLSPSEGGVSNAGDSYMIGFIALLKILGIAGRVARFVHSPYMDNPSSDETRQRVSVLGAELEIWMNTLPTNIRYASNNRERPDMFFLCVSNFFIYYSTIINLHRPFMPDDEAPTDTDNSASLGHVLNAARSCIQIGEIAPEMLPSLHYLAFAVQFITLSGVVLLRCIHYINDQTVISAIIEDAEKCVSTLRTLEDLWPASKRCREIVSDLLVMVRVKLHGGPAAIENLQAAQQHDSDRQSDMSLRGKRKRSENEGDIGERMAVNRKPPLQDEATPSGGTLRGMRLSNLRTSVPSPAPGPAPPVSVPNGNSFSMGRMYHPRGLLTPPQLTLDIDALGARQEVSNMPFAYEFLGDDLFALVGNVMNKPGSNHWAEPLSEDTRHSLRQAYSEQLVAPGPFHSWQGTRSGDAHG
ncbi:hypothetical protein CYLTODRAFT_418512 [Cylindrobasidium torrendii FP15055 ss-10]|uniref:Zn(2)-C6 fungal-type domain-containing protein n=1 Tax=Cylindrobasidium torrendii FP15055 ss-10 TaxID=1314674 RepID=A0A0D7BQC4_9AGAR|nr:hypothetical protein CYLTODRAFT_418512 [Cylindrobasidium torrendii FP15055 ss-10]